MRANSHTFNRCLERAKAKSDELFPCDCMDILLDEYGTSRMDMMIYKSIFDRIRNMMGVLVDMSEDLDSEIHSVVKSFMQPL